MIKTSRMKPFLAMLIATILILTVVPATRPAKDIEIDEGSYATIPSDGKSFQPSSDNDKMEVSIDISTLGKEVNMYIMNSFQKTDFELGLNFSYVAGVERETKWQDEITIYEWETYYLIIQNPDNEDGWNDTAFVSVDINWDIYKDSDGDGHYDRNDAYPDDPDRWKEGDNSNQMNPVDKEQVEELHSLSKLEIEASFSLTNEDASSYRQGIDANSDGSVSTSEVDTAEDSMEEGFNNTESSYMMDGHRGEMTDIAVTISGATGAVDSTDTINFETRMTVSFDSIDNEQDTHTFTCLMEQADKGADYKLTIPEGYKIESTEGIDTPVKVDNNRSVEGVTTSEDIEVSIAKRQENNDDSPGFEVLVLIPAFSTTLALLYCKRDE